MTGCTLRAGFLTSNHGRGVKFIYIYYNVSQYLATNDADSVSLG